MSPEHRKRKRKNGKKKKKARGREDGWSSNSFSKSWDRARPPDLRPRKSGPRAQGRRLLWGEKVQGPGWEGCEAGLRAGLPPFPPPSLPLSWPARPRGGGSTRPKGPGAGAEDRPPFPPSAWRPRRRSFLPQTRGPNGLGRESRGPGRPSATRKRPERKFPGYAGERRRVSAAGGMGRPAKALCVGMGQGEGRIACLPGRGQSCNSPSSARRALPLVARGRWWPLPLPPPPKGGGG